MIRKAVVAGQFYSGRQAALAADVKALLVSQVKKEEALAAVCPHAGYIYSGEVAGAVYARLQVPKVVIILCPNHTGLGRPVALMAEGAWETPLGRVPISSALAKQILKESSLIEEDSAAHMGEHSLEVQLPFLQIMREDFQLVPICLGGLSYASCEELGLGLARAISRFPEKVLLVASTDMTHYEPQEKAKRKDMKAIEKVLALDPQGLYETVKGEGISMCGYIPTTVALAAAKEVGATQAELVMYLTSGEVSGDYEQVVGYAGIIVK